VQVHFTDINNNNNNNTQDNVYGAFIVTEIVNPVHLMNVVQCQAGANPQTKPTDWGCKSASRLLTSTPTIAI